MNEIVAGVYHWTAVHPKIHIAVSSYFLAEEGILLDPLVPEGGLEALPREPRHILLTNRHHYRDSGQFVEKYGCDVRCVETGMHEFTSGEAVEPFRFGEVLPGGIIALEVGVLCPDETALWIPRGEGILAVADGVVRSDAGPLTFVPDDYLGDDPEAVKAGLKEAYRGLLDEEFDHLLLAHGHPWVGGAREALRQFVEA